VDATVVYVEYPIPSTRRAALAAIAATGYASSLAAGAAIAAHMHSLLPLIGAAITGVAAALPGLRRAVARRGKYRLSANPVPEAVVSLVEKRVA
jgi:hypothetical protein